VGGGFVVDPQKIFEQAIPSSQIRELLLEIIATNNIMSCVWLDVKVWNPGNENAGWAEGGREVEAFWTNEVTQKACDFLPRFYINNTFARFLCQYSFPITWFDMLCSPYSVSIRWTTRNPQIWDQPEPPSPRNCLLASNRRSDERYRNIIRRYASTQIDGEGTYGIDSKSFLTLWIGYFS
jgi:hypothetical protein